MKARLLPPHANYHGNLIFKKADLAGKEENLNDSLNQIRLRGYWASAFPEGDGIVFAYPKNVPEPHAEQLLTDFRECFAWADIGPANSRDSNWEAAELEDELRYMCQVMVPLTKVHLEQSFNLGKFRFVCPRDFDTDQEERLADFDGAYLQFQAELGYQDLLRAESSIQYNDALIRKCLTLAEHAMDLIRFEVCSFKRPEYTPNPAGFTEDGFYSVEIVIESRTHLKDLSLAGIVAPLSTVNNNLGPEISEPSSDTMVLYELLETRDDEMVNAVKAALRSCRQSFYSLGDESRFLNLVFALDGLSAVKREWSGWQQRTYIAALMSAGSVVRFSEVLEQYDELSSVRLNFEQIQLLSGLRHFRL